MFNVSSSFGAIHYQDWMLQYAKGKVKIVAATVINQENEAEKCAAGTIQEIFAVRGECQTAEMENLPELSGFSGYFYFDANFKDANDSAEKIKIKSIKLMQK